MSEEIRDVLSELVDTYGIKILEDPDRLSQFLEDRCSGQPEESFRLTFALRFLLKNGWRPTAHGRALSEDDYALTGQLGFTKEESLRIFDLINSVNADGAAQGAAPQDDAPPDDEVVAVPGNLKRISGGISNRPRSMHLRKKPLYNGLVMIAALLAITILFFQIGSQRTPVGDELRIAYFAPMSGPEARGSHLQLRAAQLAVERINRQGPIRGQYKLKVVGFDLPKSPEKAAAAVKKAMKDKSILVMMIGADGDGLKELAAAAEETEAPMVAVSARPSDGSLMSDNGPFLYSYSLVNDSLYRGKTLAYFATQALKKKKFAIYYDPADRVSENVRASVRKWAGAFGAQITAELPYKSGGEDHSAALKALSEGGADILILPSPGEDADEIMTAAASAAPTMQVLGENYTDSLYDSAGAALKGSWWINEVSSLDPAIRSVLKDYKSLYNENCPPEDVASAILAYDGVLWIASALRTSPGFRGEAIRHTLLATRALPLSHATLSIDPRTHLPINKAVSVIYCAKDKGIFQRRIRAGSGE